MTHDELVARAVRWLRGTKRCPVVLPELVVVRLPYVWDAVGYTRAGISHAVECKTSRGDFLRDRHKYARRFPGQVSGDHRWYLTLPGVVRGDLPDGWGLAEVRGRIVRIVTPPTRIVGPPRRQDLVILVAALARHLDTGATK